MSALFRNMSALILNLDKLITDRKFIDEILLEYSPMYKI